MQRSYEKRGSHSMTIEFFIIYGKQFPWKQFPWKVQFQNV